jgi:hypothetical protein
MASLGFEGYALDYVVCPTGMHWFLKRDLNLHRTVRCPFTSGHLQDPVLIFCLGYILESEWSRR